MRKITISLLLGAVVLFGYLLRYTYGTETREFPIEEMLRKVATPQYLNSRIKSALDLHQSDEAKLYIDLADHLNTAIDPALLKAYQKTQTPLAKAIKNTKAFGKGFFTGKSTNGIELGGSIASDFTVVGDIRDIYREGSRYLKGESYDTFLLNISLVGLAITASTYVSLGAAAPIRTGASVIKNSYRSGKLTKGFTKLVERRLAKSVDKEALKQIDFSSVAGIKSAGKVISRSIDPKPVQSLFAKLNTIKKNTSLGDTVHLLKYVDNEKELAKVAKLSSRYKKETRGILKVLGKGALRSGKTVVKWSLKLIANLAGLLLSLTGLFVTVWSLYRLKRR